MTSSIRRLVEIRRTVPTRLKGEYDAAWAELRDAVTATESHAWRFRSAGDGEAHVEYIEFKIDNDPRSSRAVADGLRRLETIAPGTTAEWIDATSSNRELTGER